MAEKAEKKELQAVREERSILYEIIRWTAQVVFHTLMPIRIHNREKLRQEPPFVLIANHQHALDPVAMAVGIPKPQLVFLAKKELAPNKFLKYLIIGQEWTLDGSIQVL